MAYLNKAMKNIVISLAACAAYPATLLELPDFPGKKKAKRNLKAAQNQAQKALDALMAEIDQDQRAGIYRAWAESEIKVLPRSSPQAGKSYYIVEAEDMETILSDALGDCAFCQRTGAAARTCVKRRALLRAGVTGAEGGDCPFKGT